MQGTLVDQAHQLLHVKKEAYVSSPVWNHIPGLPPTPPEQEVDYGYEFPSASFEVRPVTEDHKLIAVVGVGYETAHKTLTNA
jgi:hypothetical protein